ncbi:MAG: ATP-binding cassette domain-containing protein [Deltaproteobacteria bacterium]|nr:ATP-binding cassette domain-containing protein [Deltaproteobacteria bacterium]
MNDVNVIEVSNLTKWYPDVLAVNRISFSVKKGQVVGFLGPNGAGKTTTLKMLTCFLPPTSGDAWVGGQSVSQDPAGVRRRIGYLTEHNALYEEMGVEEYLRFRASLKGVPWRLRKQYVEEALESCRLTEVRHRLVGHLSKGYRQRVGMADTLVHKPPVLILDEPTVGLDPGQIIEVRALIKEVAKQNTVLLSTHYLAEVEQICDHVVIIHRGTIVANDSVETLRRGSDGSTASLESVFMKLIADTDRKAQENSDGAERKKSDEGVRDSAGQETSGDEEVRDSAGQETSGDEEVSQ